MFARQFPGAIQILDFYHACDHVALVAEAIFGTGTEAGKKWQKQRQEELKNNDVKLVIEAIAAWQPKYEQDIEVQRTQTKYFTDNAERMRYKTYIEKGYHIGSGVIEASCKHVVAQRVDQAGMHWPRNSRCNPCVTCKPTINKSDQSNAISVNGALTAGSENRTPLPVL